MDYHPIQEGVVGSCYETRPDTFAWCCTSRKKYSWRAGIWNNYPNYLRNLLQDDTKYTQIAANRENVPRDAWNWCAEMFFLIEC